MTTSCSPEVRQILVLTRLERCGSLAPCTRTGSILWNRVPGFTRWRGTYGPVLTNHELIAAIRARHGVRITMPSAMSLRRSYDVRMRLAAGGGRTWSGTASRSHRRRRRPPRCRSGGSFTANDRDANGRRRGRHVPAAAQPRCAGGSDHADDGHDRRDDE